MPAQPIRLARVWKVARLPVAPKSTERSAARWPAAAVGRFDKACLRVGVSQLLQLALEQRVRFGVVHQFHLVGELGIKADRQDILLERQGMRVAEVTAGKRAGPPDSSSNCCHKG